jgi:hypothetical protein
VVTGAAFVESTLRSQFACVLPPAKAALLKTQTATAKMKVVWNLIVMIPSSMLTNDMFELVNCLFRFCSELVIHKNRLPQFKHRLFF